MVVKDDADTVGVVLWQHLLGAPCFRAGFCSKTIIPDSEEHPLASSRAVPKDVLRWIRDKAHEKEADILLARLSKIKLGQIVLPAISTGSFVTVLLGTGWWGSLVGGVFSAALLALNLYTRNYDLGKQAQQHTDAAINIWSIREKYLSLITDLAMECESLSDIQLKRDALTDELKESYANSPRTTEAAYKKAHKALNLLEEMTFSVAEVDAFLPQVLRRKQ